MQQQGSQAGGGSTRSSPVGSMTAEAAARSPAGGGDGEEQLRLYQPAMARGLAEDSSHTRQVAVAASAEEQGQRRIIGSGTAHPQFGPDGGSSPSSPATAALSAWEARKRAQRAAQEARVHAEAERFREVSRRRAADEAARKDAEFEATLTGIVAGIIEGDGITGATQAVLDDANKESAERQAALYAEWREQVFEKIQARIREGMSHRTVAELEEQLQAAAASYVAATNAKPLGVYLDVVMPGEYDPLGPARRAVKITTRDLFDPVKKDLLKTQAEKQLLNVSAAATSPSSGGRGGGSGRGSPSTATIGEGGQPRRGTTAVVSKGGTGGTTGSSGSLSERRRRVGRPGEAAAAGTESRSASAPPPGPTAELLLKGPAAALQLAPAVTRETLQTTSWGALQIRATPHCHCISSEGAYTVRPPAPAALAMGASRLKLDDFSPAPPDPYRPSKRMGGGEARADHIEDVVKWRWAEPGGMGASPALGGGGS